MLKAILLGAILILALIGTMEIISLCLHKFWRKSIKITTLSVIPLSGHIDNIEYILSAVKSELCWLKNSSSKLIVLNLGIDDECEKIIEKIEGVELFNKEDLYPLLEKIG